jgi:hypothetical protein
MSRHATRHLLKPPSYRWRLRTRRLARYRLLPVVVSSDRRTTRLGAPSTPIDLVLLLGWLGQTVSIWFHYVRDDTVYYPAMRFGISTIAYSFLVPGFAVSRAQLFSQHLRQVGPSLTSERRPAARANYALLWSVAGPKKAGRCHSAHTVVTSCTGVALGHSEGFSHPDAIKM